ncbi:hypothetical protein I7I50_09977 [Histoplasma capsulatum G186AR]|uniref:Uncharacterized protein n=1 Tax=Ajellomyces capsulatus TaxID=5037 RepID=A0A8H7Z8T2_AJECA|nr:hypothetical protein I7I52_01215 [Histoplasma capsulatum]QSS68866.1 hypothetical protein I7I50_09977 [Histoplasma capsulatum G186AR]
MVLKQRIPRDVISVTDFCHKLALYSTCTTHTRIVLHMIVTSVHTESIHTEKICNQRNNSMNINDLNRPPVSDMCLLFLSFFCLCDQN